MISGPAPSPQISYFSQSQGVDGSRIVIWGNYPLGVTSVEFNGLPAEFQNESVNAVVAVVPNGALSGPVTVTTPHGTAVRPANFTVP
jgi:large repetitive protein